MSRRKGEITPRRIDRDFPHQVELPAAMVVGANGLLADAVAKALASVAPRHNSAHRDGEFFIRYAFADPADAETFYARFGGLRLTTGFRRGRYFYEYAPD